MSSIVCAVDIAPPAFSNARLHPFVAFSIPRPPTLFAVHPPFFRVPVFVFQLVRYLCFRASCEERRWQRRAFADSKWRSESLNAGCVAPVRRPKQSGSRSLKSPSMCSKPRASTSSFFVTIPLHATSLARSPPAANRPVRGRRYLRAVGRFHRPVPECLLRLSSSLFAHPFGNLSFSGHCDVTKLHHLPTSSTRTRTCHRCSRILP